jgi:hypothetical protein
MSTTEKMSSSHWIDWLIKSCIISLPTIAVSIIGMYIQLQQLVTTANSADKEITFLKVEISQLKKEYVSREELTRTIQFISNKKGN